VHTGVNPNFVVSDTNTVEQVKNFIIDVIYKVPSIDSLVKPNADGEVYFTALDSVTEIINTGVEKFHEFNFFLGLNISDTPWNIMTDSFSSKNFLLVFAALMIPITSYLTQVISFKLMPTSNNNNNENDMMAQQMKMMNKMMPLMSLFFCFTLPVGLGIYWVASSAYRVIQQIILKKYFDNIDVQKIIKKNEAKAAKKREKMGVYENQIREAAAMRTRTLSSKAGYDNSAAADIESQIDRANELKTTAKPGSLSAKANMVRDYNERNSRK
jgi:YidC/Oxa1 family membrane protein insertase